MPTFIIIHRLSPELTRLLRTNPKARKAVSESVGKTPEIKKKYGIKTIGSWTARQEHLIIMVEEAPSLEVFQKYHEEPDVAIMDAYMTREIKIVSPEAKPEDIYKLVV